MSGRDGAGGIAPLQRARLLAAMAQATRELGAGRVSVADVISRCGISRRTFYENFSDRDDCLVAAMEEALARARARVEPVYREQGEWREAIRAGLAAFLAYLDEDSPFGALLVVDAPCAPGRAQARREQLIASLAAELDRGRPLARSQAGLSPITAEGALGGMLEILRRRLLASRPGSMLALAPELTAFVILPYLGPAAAAGELRRPVPAAGRRATGNPDPLIALPLRPTLRTVQVLGAIAAQPGATNAQVAASAGVSDQGQISKLLSRLARLGLIRNANSRRGRRAGNSWQLTRRGVELEQAIRARER